MILVTMDSMQTPSFSMADLRKFWNARGNFDQGPKSQSFQKRVKGSKDRENEEDRAQDDSIVYSESKSSKHGAKLRPQRRGESFNIKSTTGSSRKRDSYESPGRPVSWQSMSALSNHGNKSQAETPGGGSVKSLADAAATYHSLQNLASGKSRGSLPRTEESTLEDSTSQAGSSMSMSMSWHGDPLRSLGGEPPPKTEPRRKVYQYLNHESRLDFSPKSRRRGLPDNSSHKAPHDATQSLQDVRYTDPQNVPHPGFRGYPARSQPPLYVNYENYENIEAFDSMSSGIVPSPNRSQSSGSLNPERYFLNNRYPSASSSVSQDSLQLSKSSNLADVDPSKLPCSPPAPPVRDASSLKYVKSAQPHEKFPSWPSVEQGGEKEKNGNSWSNSWTSNSTNSLEKKSKLYQPQLNTHREEKSSEPVHRLLDQDSLKKPAEPQFHTDLIHRAVVAKVENLDSYGLESAFESKSELKNVYKNEPSYPYPTYDRDGRLRDDKDYVVPSPPERDIPVDKQSGSATGKPPDMSTLDELLQQYAAPPSVPPPPIPTIPPPPPLSPSSTSPGTSASSQGGPGQMVFTMARSPQHSSYTYIVRSKPYYNTSTQTEDQPTQTSPDIVSSTTEIKDSNVIEYRHVEVQTDMDYVSSKPAPSGTIERKRGRKSERSTQIIEADLVTQAVNALKESSSGVPGDLEPHLRTDTNPEPSAKLQPQFPDKVENRIPETIREESPNKTSPGQPQSTPGKSSDGQLRENILAQIHEHSPSQTYMLRKLSQEFYGSQSKLSYGMKRSVQMDRDRTSSKELLRPFQHEQRLPGENLHLRPGSQHSSSDYWSDNEGTLQDRSRASSMSERTFEGSNLSLRSDKENSLIPPELPEKVGDSADKTSPLSRQMSLKKAYGIFEEIENFDDHTGRKLFPPQGKSVSTSNVPHSRILEGKEGRTIKGRESLPGKTSHSASDHQLGPGSYFAQSSDLKHAVIPESPKKLKRTTSEQIRPMKDRASDHHKLSDPKEEVINRRMDSAYSSIASSALDSSRRSSDLEMPGRQRLSLDQPLPEQSRLSDPKRMFPESERRLSDPKREKRLSTDSESRRSDSRHSNRDSEHRLSDPKRDKLSSSGSEHQLSDSRRDKRISADSDVFGSLDVPSPPPSVARTSSVRSASSGSMDSHRMSDPELKKVQQNAVWSFFEMKTGKRLSSSSMDSSIGMGSERTGSTPLDKYDASLSPNWRERSPSPQKTTGRERERSAQMKKSKSLPREMSAPLSPPAAGDVNRMRNSMPDTAFRERRSSASDRRRSASDFRHRKERSAPSQLESEGVKVVEDGWDNSRLSCDLPSPTQPPTKTSQSKEEPNESVFESPQTYPKTFEYSSSSSGGSSPSKPVVDYQQKIGYQVTVNQTYREEDDDHSPPPPTLPPRNYRPSLPDKFTNTRRSDSHQRAHTYGNDHGSGPRDFENTPKAEYYADQLREQARRISRSQPTMLNPARYQPKPLPEMKTCISVSRPVDKPPVAQEARAPPTIYRSVQIPKDLNFVGISTGDPPVEYKPVISPPAAGESRLNTSQEEENLYEPIEVQPDSDGGYLSPIQIENYTNSKGSPHSPGTYHNREASGNQHPYVVDNVNTNSAQSLNNQRSLKDAQHHLPSDVFTNSRISPHHDKEVSGRDEAPSSPDLLPSPPPLPGSAPPPLQHQEIIEEPRKQLVVTSDQNKDRRYSTESYMVSRGNVRQGFGGQYKRQESEAGVSLPTSPPPPPETMVKVSTMMTVKSSMPPTETKMKPEASPRRIPEQANPNVQQPEVADSPNVRAFVANFERRDVYMSRSQRPQVPRTKVQELKESLLRRSQENLAELGSPNNSPHRSTENLVFIPEHQPKPSRTFVSLNEITKVPANPSSDRSNKLSPSSEHFARHGLNNKSLSLLPSPSESRPEVPAKTPHKEDLHPTTPSGGENPPSSPPDSLPTYSPPPPPSGNNSPTTSVSETKTVSTSSSSATPISSPTNNSKEPEPVSAPAEPPKVVHVRQKSEEEIAYERHALVVASQLADRDRSLMDVIVPPPEHKTACDYMSGIFTPPTVTVSQRRRTIQNITNSSSSQDSTESSDSTTMSSVPSSSVYWSPPGVANLHNKMREEGVDASSLMKDVGGANISLERQKEELVNRLEKKLEILRNEKAAMAAEVVENNKMGKEVEHIVEAKCQQQSEVNKYKLYVDELDKVMYLLLKLSGRLARAQNAVLSLTDDASSRERSILTAKRDELKGKHEDAKQLKEGIDRRSQQVATYLRKYLSPDEFADYEYFIQMKSKLNIDMQEIEDKIKLGEEQLVALKRNLNTTSS